MTPVYPSVHHRTPVRGMMLDSARLMERVEFYYELIVQLAQWGYNTLWWHFCDDEGFSIKFKSHPELATPYALSVDEMRNLIRHARTHGIDLVLEVESLGHALAITSLPQYRHLLNGDPHGHNALCPSHPDSLHLLADLIAEAVDISESPFLHVGLDEAKIGDCPRCAARAAGRPPWWLFAEHATAIHRIVTAKGRRMIMWADMVEKHPALLDVLPKDIVLTHWHYTEVPEHKIHPSAVAGFSTILAGAISNPIVQPGHMVFQNIRDNAELMRALAPQGNLGMVVCWWESHRHLRDTYPLAAKYAVDAMGAPEVSDESTYTRPFIRDYFGLDHAEVAAALWRLHEAVLDIPTMQALFPHSFVALHQALLYEKGNPGWAKCQKAVEVALDVLENAAADVMEHGAHYNAYLLSGRITLQALRNASHLRDAFQHYSAAVHAEDCKRPPEQIAPHLNELSDTLHRMANELALLVRAVGTEWDRTRHAADAKKFNASPYMRQRGPKGILPMLSNCEKFIQVLQAQFLGVGGLKVTGFRSMGWDGDVNWAGEVPPAQECLQRTKARAGQEPAPPEW